MTDEKKTSIKAFIIPSIILLVTIGFLFFLISGIGENTPAKEEEVIENQQEAQPEEETANETQESEQPESEENNDTVVFEEEPEPIEEPQEEVKTESFETYYVDVVGYNTFSSSEIDIKVNDKVIFRNTEGKPIKGAIIIGSNVCREIKSPQLKPGEEFEVTFEKPIRCIIVEAISKTSTLVVNVVE